MLAAGSPLSGRQSRDPASASRASAADHPGLVAWLRTRALAEAEGRTARVHSEEQAVRLANHAFYRAFETLALERMDEAWWHDGQVTCVHPGWPLASGWDEVRHTWATIFRHTQSIHFDVTDERIDVRGDLAWVVCVERIDGSSTTGERAAALATNVLRRVGDTWRLVHHHASPFVPRRDEPAPRTAPRGTLN